MQAGYRLLAAALICAALALATDAFLTLGNILNVLRQTALLFLMASGLTLVDPHRRPRPLGRRQYRRSRPVWRRA